MAVTGKVYLVGGGPGDPGLVTVKGVAVLRLADVVLYDFLVHPSLLRYCAQADKICVGKKKGYHSKRQDEINALMCRFALEGKCVVRLKGGDPAIFGRIGEIGRAHV